MFVFILLLPTTLDDLYGHPRLTYPSNVLWTMSCIHYVRCCYQIMKRPTFCQLLFPIYGFWQLPMCVIMQLNFAIQTECDFFVRINKNLHLVDCSHVWSVCNSWFSCLNLVHDITAICALKMLSNRNDPVWTLLGPKLLLSFLLTCQSL